MKQRENNVEQQQQQQASHHHDHNFPTTTDAVAATTIDNLPENLILHILSFLPTLDTVTTSLVSKKWYPLWTMVPSLSFSLTHFPPYKTFSTTRHFFSKFIDRSLISRSHSTLCSFRLQFIYQHHFHPDVDSWVRYAVNHHAQEIYLDFFIDKSFFIDNKERDVYDFPFSFLKKGKVGVLKLTGCDLNLPSNMSSLRLWFIKSLHLDQIYLTDQMCLDLISGCPNLEILELANCYGMDSLKIRSRSLKELELEYFIRNDTEFDLDIDCPNLVRLSVIWFEVVKCCFKNLFNLVHFRTSIEHKYDEYYRYWSNIVSLLDQMPQIKSLAVQNWWLKLAPKEVFSKDFLLYNLKHLELQTGYTQYDLLGMEALLELAPNVETMILDYLYKIVEDESLSEELLSKPIKLNIPSLKEVKLKEFRKTEDEANFLVLLKKQGIVLEKIVVVPTKVGDIECAPIVLHRIP